jgi:uncharacterized protein with PIN domain/prolyl-tRNA editing enzyme YbaK/EbsC (Cys-tRNA(Pro) deacylase)
MSSGIGFGLASNVSIRRWRSQNWSFDRGYHSTGVRQNVRNDFFGSNRSLLRTSFRSTNAAMIINENSPAATVRPHKGNHTPDEPISDGAHVSGYKYAGGDSLQCSSGAGFPPCMDSLSLSSALTSSETVTPGRQVPRCRQHYRLRCRKCFPAAPSKRSDSSLESPSGRTLSVNHENRVVAEPLLGDIGWAAVTTYWQSVAGLMDISRRAFQFGKLLQTLLREQPQMRMTIIRAYREVFCLLHRTDPERGYDRVLFVAAWMMQSLRWDSFVWTTATTCNDQNEEVASRERFAWTDNALRAIVGAVDAALGASNALHEAAEHRAVNQQNPKEHTATDSTSSDFWQLEPQYQGMASALLDWRLRLPPADEVAQRHRFADPRVLVKISRQWCVSKLDDSVTECATQLFYDCISRKCWYAALEWLHELSRLALVTGPVLAERRALLFETLMKQQQWHLARKCAEDWGDTKLLEQVRWLQTQEIFESSQEFSPEPITQPLLRLQEPERGSSELSLYEFDAAMQLPTPTGRSFTDQECEQGTRLPGCNELSLCEFGAAVQLPTPTGMAPHDRESEQGVKLPGLETLQLPPTIRIHWVATVSAVEHLQRFLQTALESGIASCPSSGSNTRTHCVGLDLEWKPVRTAGLEPRCALLQIAFPEDVFLIDLLQIDRDPSFSDLLNEVLLLLFRSSDLLKVGFGFSADLTRLRRSYQHLCCFDWIVSLRDLDRVDWEDSDSFCTMLAARVGRTSIQRRRRLTIGLAQLVAAVLERSMDKRLRCSNWETRPLSPAQIAYAALDAWVLLALVQQMPAAAGRRVGIVRRPMSRVGYTTASVSRLQTSMSADLCAAIHKTALERVMSALTAPNRWRERPVYRIGDTLYGGPFCPLIRPGASGNTRDIGQVCDAASALGVAETRIGKCIALMAADQYPVLVIMAGQRRVPLRRLAPALGLSSSSALRFATPPELVEIFGFTPGTVSPLGLLKEHDDHEWANRVLVPTFMDDALQSAEIAGSCRDRGALIFVSAGSPESLLAIQTTDLVHYRHALWISALPEVGVCEKAPAPTGTAATHALARSQASWFRRYFTNRREGYFVVDSTMGGLVRRLRALGMDVLHTPEKNIALLFKLARMPVQNDSTESCSTRPRVILTRDTEILSRALRHALPCYYVATMQTEQQTQEVLEAFQLFPDPERFLARCVQCNCARFEQRTREQVRPYLPLRTVESFEIFYECTQCHQLYWKGAHFERATQQLSATIHRLWPGAQAPPSP